MLVGFHEAGLITGHLPLSICQMSSCVLEETNRRPMAVVCWVSQAWMSVDLRHKTHRETSRRISGRTYLSHVTRDNPSDTLRLFISVVPEALIRDKRRQSDPPTTQTRQRRNTPIPIALGTPNVDIIP